MTEIKYFNKWKDIAYPWVGKPNIIKILFLPKLTHRLYAILINISVRLFVAINSFLACIWKGNGMRKLEEIELGNRRLERSTSSNYYIAIAFQTV